MNKNILIGGAALIVIILLVVGVVFILPDGKEITTVTFTVESQFHDDDNSLSFYPNKIEVNEGDKVVIVFEVPNNAPLAPHNLHVHGYDIMTEDVAPGESDTIEFIATNTGTFTIMCDVAGHADLGMTGELVVTILDERAEGYESEY